MEEDIDRKKYITLEYEEYLELKKYKEAFKNLKYGYQEGKRFDNRNKMTWCIENKTELYDLLSKLSMHPERDDYDSILIVK